MEEINVQELFKYYMSKIVIVITFVLIGAIGSWYYTEFKQVPKYKSETSLVLTRSNEAATITQTDINLNKNLVSTYREIIKSRRILVTVIDNLNLNMEVSQLKGKISVRSANDTELIVISVTDENKKLARDIANEIAKVFKEEITTIYNIENISIVDQAVKATAPYNINVTKQYIIGIALGFILASGIIVVMFYFDDSVKTAEDIEQKVGLNVLSQVPKYKSKKVKKEKEEKNKEEKENSKGEK